MTSQTTDAHLSAIAELTAELKTAHTRAIFLCEAAPLEWFSDQPNLTIFDNTRQSNYRQYLGGEESNLLIDAREYVNANAIAALIGTLTSGGLAFILLPHKSAWSPFIKRLVALGNTQVKLLAAVTEQNLWQQQLQRHCRDLASNVKQLPPAATPDYPSAEQQRWLQQINDTVPQLLLADRGRGKSTALGLALNRYPERKVIVTAPQRAAVTTMQHASTRHFSFVAWQTLYEQRKPADNNEWLIIDEAAALPKPVLLSLLEHYRVWLVATTLDGYEGCGRSVGNQLIDLVSRAGGAVSYFKQPVRWRPDDLVETWLNQSFMLKLDLAHAPPSKTPVTYQFAHTQALTESQCQQLMNLMLEAHYQTQPSDLKRLFDDPDQWLLLAWQDERLIGAVWLMKEGELATELSNDILKGQRRPPGNLLPQALGRYFQDAQLLRKRWWRVARIAVQPGHRRRGIGGQLLAQIRRYADEEGVDLIGTAFGQREDLLSFWQKHGFHPVCFGRKLNKSSGESTVYCIDSHSQDGRLFDNEREFANHLHAWLSKGELKPLTKPGLTTLIDRQLEAFANGYLGFPEAQFALLQSCRRRFAEDISQPISTAEIARQNGYASQTDFVQALRHKLR